MKMIWALLVVGFFFIYSPAVFAANDYDEGYQYAADNPNVGETQCRAGRSEEFTRGCLNRIVEDVGIQLGGQ